MRLRADEAAEVARWEGNCVAKCRDCGIVSMAIRPVAEGRSSAL